MTIENESGIGVAKGGKEGTPAAQKLAEDVIHLICGRIGKDGIDDGMAVAILFKTLLVFLAFQNRTTPTKAARRLLEALLISEGGKGETLQ